jgi:hypothetical protein
MEIIVETAPRAFAGFILEASVGFKLEAELLAIVEHHLLIRVLFAIIIGLQVVTRQTLLG